jgi:hypothetical protein
LSDSLDEEQLRSLTELLIDASSSGRPPVTPASAGLLDAKSEDQRLWRRSCWRWHLTSERLAVVHVLG